MKTISVETALEFIENKFHEFGAILDIDTSSIIDIICKDLDKGQYYEVYSNEDWTSLNICKINLK